MGLMGILMGILYIAMAMSTGGYPKTVTRNLFHVRLRGSPKPDIMTNACHHPTYQMFSLTTIDPSGVGSTSVHLIHHVCRDFIAIFLGKTSLFNWINTTVGWRYVARFLGSYVARWLGGWVGRYVGI